MSSNLRIMSLFSKIMAFTIGCVFLLQATPAASQVPQSTPTAFSYHAKILEILPLNDSTSILLWVDTVNDGNVFKSSVLSPDGTLGESGEVFPSDTDYQFRLSEKNSWTVLPDGTYALVAEVNVKNTTLNQIAVVYSDNGLDWSLPVVVDWDESYSDDPDSYFGKRNPQIAADGLGHLAIQYRESYISESSRLVTRFSPDGQQWSSATSVQPDINSVFDYTIIGSRSGGFVSSWATRNGNDEKRWVARTVNSSLAIWNKPISISNDYQNRSGAELVQSTPTEIALIFVTSSNATYSYGVYAKRFSTLTKSWSNTQTILTTGDPDFSPSKLEVGVNKSGLVAAALVSDELTQGRSKIHVGSFRGVEVGISSVPVSLETLSFLSGVYPNGDGTITLVYSGQFFSDVELKTIGRGSELDPVPLGFAGDEAKTLVSGVTPTGNLFVASLRGRNHSELIDVGEFLAIERAEAPVANSAVRITGSAKLGKTLNASGFSFRSISGLGTTTFQWYSCSRAVPANTTVKASTCSAISKATGSTFKVTSKQRGRYITVAVKNTNAVGTTTLFAPVSSKAK
jgi:hypothetical protein